MPHCGIAIPVSSAALRDQITEPVLASRALRMPVAPSEITRFPARVGVQRGPGPACDSSNLALSLCFHTGLPFVRL